MQQHTPPHLSSVGKRFFDLIEFDDDERLICEIRKHPIGLAIICIIGGLTIAAIIVITLLLALSPSVSDAVAGAVVGNGTSISLFAVLIGALLVLLVGVVTVIGAVLYENNVIFVTNEKVAQVLYTSLFGRKISQLNIGNVQDVTVGQSGILARMFDYGTLVIETAGEQQNYTFTFAPKPYLYSKDIITAHEQYEKEFGN